MRVQRDANLDELGRRSPRPVAGPNARLADVGLSARDGRQDGPCAVTEGDRVRAPGTDRAPHQPHLQASGFGQDVGHLKGNGVGRILIEDLPEKVAARTDDGCKLEFVELMEIGHGKHRIDIASKTGIRLDADRPGIVHPQEIPRRVRPGVQRVLPPVDGCIVPPLLGAISKEYEVIGPIELPIPIVDHVDWHGNEVQGARLCVVQGKGIATMSVKVDPPGIHRGRVQSQLGQQGNVHFVESGLGGGNAVPLTFRQRTVLGPNVVELGRQPEGSE